MRLIPSHPLHNATAGCEAIIVASETRDGVPWLVIEFVGYGTVTAPADQFEEA